MRDFMKVCVVGMLLLMPVAAWATHPLGVEYAGTEGKGNYLFEITGDHTKDNDLNATKLAAAITAGAGKHVDLTLEVPYVMLDPSPATGLYERGEGDARVKFKHQLYGNEVGQSMAYLIYADLPTGDHLKGTGTNNVLWGVMLIDSQECRNRALHLNVGYEVLGRDIKDGHYADNYAIRFGLAAEHKMTESFRVLSEFAGESRKETDVEADIHSYSRPFTFLVGVIYDISKSWYVDLGGRAGLNKYAEDYSMLAGTAWRF
jgi:Putative MetA-pathway of phenol degradation